MAIIYRHYFCLYKGLVTQTLHERFALQLLRNSGYYLSYFLNEKNERKQDKIEQKQKRK